MSFHTTKGEINTCLNIGIVANIGNSINRLGITANAYTIHKNYQFNFRLAVSYNLQHWGNLSSTPELQIGWGTVYAFGQTDSTVRNIDLVSNNTFYKNSLGYAYNFYLDRNHTSQRTGTIGIQFAKWRIISENDILGELGSDKYRTAAALISYSYMETEIGLKMILWTGDFRAKETSRIKTDTLFDARFGYYDLSKSEHGKESHGILCIQAHKTLEYSQQAKCMIGIDAEQVRNVFQNKLMHDAFFVPERLMNYKNLHFPMINSNGDLYKYRNDEKVRKPKPFINISTNNNIFY